MVYIFGLMKLGALKFNFTLTKFFVAKIMPNTIGTKHDIEHRLKNLPTLKRMES